MTRQQKTIAWIAVAAVVAILVTARAIHAWRSSTRPVDLIGAVLREDSDPRKQSPIANAKVTAVGGSTDEIAKSDSSGFFKVTVHPGLLPGRPLTLKVEHAEYRPLEITAAVKDFLYVVRMEPLVREPPVTPDHTPAAPGQPIPIKDVRVRYSLKNQTTINVGSLVRQFEVVNSGNVPCKGRRPCSPDGKWKAATGTLALDAQKGNEFRNVRVSCIAGPCPFTRLDPADLSRPTPKIEITALDWSDTASFRVEAEVTSTKERDMVLQSYPFVNGQTMTFALPPAAEGPSVIADLNAEPIVFPLGPNLILSWATCSVEVAPGRNKIYRCELKPGYQFQ